MLVFVSAYWIFHGVDAGGVLNPPFCYWTPYMRSNIVILGCKRASVFVCNRMTQVLPQLTTSAIFIAAFISVDLCSETWALLFFNKPASEYYVKIQGDNIFISIPLCVWMSEVMWYCGCFKFSEPVSFPADFTYPDCSFLLPSLYNGKGGLFSEIN
jgi:hypothetical protein